MLNHLLRCPHPLQQSPIIQNADPEDGFGEDIESRLITRGLGKITEWEGLYRALFPNDELIPESSICLSLSRTVHKGLTRIQVLNPLLRIMKWL